MARIGIDARFYGPIGKGLGRYTQKLIENLEKIDKTNEYFVFLKKENFNDYIPKNKNFRKVLADFRWYTFDEQINFPRLLNKYKLDLMHFPHFNVPIFYFGKFIVTIHDLILIHFPTVRSSTLSPFFYWLKFLAYRLVINSAIRRSRRIIAVSKFTKKDILNNYRSIPQEKIIVTYEACEDFCMLSPNKDKEIIARYGIIEPYIMYVGNAYPHKNLERLVLAFEKIKERRKDLTLVFVGNLDYFYRRLKDMAEDKRVKGVMFIGYVPDHELDTIFHNAEAFVWPSLYEGFGLPPLEAMSKGTPVISSDHMCMREVLEDSAYYFDAKNLDSIASSIGEVLENKNLQEELIRKGYKQVEKYSWRRMARETLEIYEKLH
jgi:glycosyltransferase involved in cell wall biosynthesis